MKKTFTGIVVGIKHLANGRYIVFCNTDRYNLDDGVGVDTVFTSTSYSVDTLIEYSIKKTRKGYICYA